MVTVSSYLTSQLSLIVRSSPNLFPSALKNRKRLLRESYTESETVKEVIADAGKRAVGRTHLLPARLRTIAAGDNRAHSSYAHVVVLWLSPISN